MIFILFILCRGINKMDEVIIESNKTNLKLREDELPCCGLIEIVFI